MSPLPSEASVSGGMMFDGNLLIRTLERLVSVLSRNLHVAMDRAFCTEFCPFRSEANGVAARLADAVLVSK